MFLPLTDIRNVDGGVGKRRVHSIDPLLILRCLEDSWIKFSWDHKFWGIPESEYDWETATQGTSRKYCHKRKQAKWHYKRDGRPGTHIGNTEAGQSEPAPPCLPGPCSWVRWETWQLHRWNEEFDEQSWMQELYGGTEDGDIQEKPSRETSLWAAAGWHPGQEGLAPKVTEDFFTKYQANYYGFSMMARLTLLQTYKMVLAMLRNLYKEKKKKPKPSGLKKRGEKKKGFMLKTEIQMPMSLVCLQT